MTSVVVSSGCGHRGCVGSPTDRLVTAPTVVTLVRTALAVGLAVVAMRTGSSAWLLAALAAYWIGDTADGMLARLTDTETRTGAVLDIVSDRCCVAMIYLPFATWNPEFALPLGIYLVEFMVIDTFLSLAFLSWPIVSPNYFGLIDRPLYLLNWTPIAKGANSGAIAIAAVLLDAPGLATVLALGLLAVKTGCLGRLARLPAWTATSPTGCALAPV